MAGNTGVRKYGNVSNGTPNPANWTVDDDGTGMLSGTATFHYDFRFGSKVTDLSLPKKGDSHPFDSRLQAREVKAQYGSNEVCVVNVNYVGIKQALSGLTWDLSAPTNDEPIDTHPDFFTFGTITGGTEAPKTPGGKPAVATAYYPTGIPKWNRANVEVDNNQKFVAFKWNKETGPDGKDLAGVRSFKRPAATMRVNFSSTVATMAGWAIGNLGKYYPAVPFESINKELDTTGGTRTWMLTSASVSVYSGIYKVQCEFTLSGDRGWNKLIYKAGVPPTDPNAVSKRNGLGGELNPFGTSPKTLG